MCLIYGPSAIVPKSLWAYDDATTLELKDTLTPIKLQVQTFKVKGFNVNVGPRLLALEAKTLPAPVVLPSIAWTQPPACRC